MDNQIMDFLKARTLEEFSLEKETVVLRPILKGGSDRDFYHLESQGKLFCILMHYGEEKQENFYYVDIARFFKTLNVPAPEILAHDEKNRVVWMQDLGEADLYSRRNRDWATKSALYRQALEAIERLHDDGLRQWEQKPFALMDGFGAELYRWEQDYFWKQFVEDACHVEMNASEKNRIQAELHTLSEHLCALPPGLVHRDFQSQNIMLNDEKVFFIDFQGMRKGTKFYDLGSLLFDPYVEFSPEQRMELLRYYYELRKRAMDWVSFEKAFYEASIQRLLQALGAYGFLGIKKQKTHFLSYIPAALKNVKAAVDPTEDFHAFRRLLCLLEEESQKCISHFSCVGID
ncbi:MAG: aminoglycoside phosphotransferase family protein [Verrucomicrobiota bacterium]